MRSKWFVLFAVLVIASMLLASCQTAPKAPAELPNLRVNLTSYPDSIDPQKASFVNEIAHLKIIYEGLTRLNEKLETVPGAAEKWAYNADATELTFTLRKDLKYSDGKILNAKRFEYSILRNIDPATAGEYASITDEIKGAAEWRGVDVSKVTPEEQAKLKEAVMVKALDASGAACKDYEQADCLTLKIGLSKPAPYFHTVMSLWVTFPAREEEIKAGGDTWWNDAKYHIGNGPFKLTALEPTVKGVFEPNPNYWRGQAKYKLEFRYITDTAVAFEAYKNGEFDIITLAAEDLKTVEADATLNAEKLIYPGSCTFNVNFHQLKEPFTDKKVREAFIYAVDRDGWVKDVLKGLGATTLTWIPKGFPGYDASESRYAFDPEKAKKALAESSYGSVDKLPEITATFPDTPRNRSRWEWLVAKWKEVLGVEIKLNPVESTTFTALTKDVNTAPQMFILGWCADYPDPQNWLSVYWMSSSSFADRIGYKNADVDAKMQAADVELDTTKRMGLYDEAQKLLVDSAPGAFMWNNVNSYLVKPYVKGIATTPQDSGWSGDNDPLTITIEKK